MSERGRRRYGVLRADLPGATGDAEQFDIFFNPVGLTEKLLSQ